MIEYVGEDLEGMVAVRITNTISQKDYEALIAEIEKKIAQFGKINFYLEIREGVRWNAKSFWSDMNFNLKHAQDIRKVAFVGDNQFEEKIIELIRPLQNSNMRWYPYPERKEALSWLGAGKRILQHV